MNLYCFFSFFTKILFKKIKLYLPLEHTTQSYDSLKYKAHQFVRENDLYLKPRLQTR